MFQKPGRLPLRIHLGGTALAREVAFSAEQFYAVGGPRGACQPQMVAIEISSRVLPEAIGGNEQLSGA